MSEWMEANKESECVRKHRNNNNNNSLQVRLYVIVMLNGYNLIYPSLFIYLTIAVKLYHRHILSSTLCTQTSG